MESTEAGRPLGLGSTEGLGCNAQAVARERPILFSAPMVRALLAGTKTQTRRALNPRPQPWGQHGGLQLPGYCASTDAAFRHGAPIFKSRFGKPGDRLWVRETFAKIDGQTQPWIETDYRATYTHGDRLGDSLGIKKRWTPAIHMPRSASRITLEVTAVRVERLQEISEADAIAEGVNRFPGCRQDDDAAAFNRIGPVDNDSFPIARYAVLWESINGPGSWEANPWVWVVEFQRSPNLQPNEKGNRPA